MVTKSFDKFYVQFNTSNWISSFMTVRKLNYSLEFDFHTTVCSFLINFSGIMSDSWAFMLYIFSSYLEFWSSCWISVSAKSWSKIYLLMMSLSQGKKISESVKQVRRSDIKRLRWGLSQHLLWNFGTPFLILI